MSLSRRSSVSASPNLSGRRASMGGATPNLATPSADPRINRKGSLKDLAAQREAMNKAVNDQKSQLLKYKNVFRQFLASHSVSELRPSIKTLVDIDGSMKPLDGFEVLLKNQIEAAPVYTLGKNSTKEYTGFLDIRDLVSSVVFVLTQPINEDQLVFTSNGGAEVAFAPSAHGLDGLAAFEGMFQKTEAPPSLESMTEEGGQAPLAATTDAHPEHPSNDPESDADSDKLDRQSSLSRSKSIPAPSAGARNAPYYESPRSSSSELGLGGSSPVEEHKVGNTNLTWAETVRRGMGKFSSKASDNAITLTYLSRRNPFKPITQKSSLSELAEHMAHQHRVPVVDVRGRIVDIVSQTALIEFMVAHSSEMKEMSTLPVESLDLGSREIHSVKANVTALDTFVRMDEVRRSGLVIEDEDGRLVGATSSRDLKRFALDKGKLKLDVSIIDYLMAARGKPIPKAGEAGIEKEDEFSKTGAVCLSASATVVDVLNALARHGTNRIFLVDDNKEPMRVVSLSDFVHLALVTIGSPLPENRSPRGPRGD